MAAPALPQQTNPKERAMSTLAEVEMKIVKLNEVVAVVVQSLAQTSTANLEQVETKTREFMQLVGEINESLVMNYSKVVDNYQNYNSSVYHDLKKQNLQKERMEMAKQALQELVDRVEVG